MRSVGARTIALAVVLVMVLSVLLGTQPAGAADAAPPTAPKYLKVTSKTATSIAMSWTASTDDVGVDYYNVHKNGDKVAAVQSTSYTYTGLACGTSYKLSVRAFDAAGRYSAASEISASTAACSGVTVTVDRTVQTGTSSLSLGVSHGHHSADDWENPTAVSSARNILKSSTTYQAQHIYGWGAENPQPTKTTYDWQSLDGRVATMRESGSTPVIVLCCVPDWMTSKNTYTSDYPLLPPTPADYADFVALAKKVALRYPDVTRYVFWNQMKGWWSSSLNNWDYVEYTKLYNLVYDALKAINPAIKLGGPYLAIDGTGVPLSARNVQLIDYWLSHKRGADYLAVTYSIVPWVSPSMPSTASILASTSRIENVTQQLKAKTTLPIWYIEDYFDGDFSRLDYASHNFQTAAMGSLLLHEVRSGVAASFRFQPEGTGTVGYQGNQQSLWTDTSTAGGGKAFPLAAAYQLVKSKFPPGTKLYKTTSSSTDIEVIASWTTTMLVNKRPSPVTVSVAGTIVSLAPYQVLAI